jgi:hypothetical protein
MRGFALRGTAPEVGWDRRRVTAMIRGWSWLRAIRRVGFRFGSEAELAPVH